MKKQKKELLTDQQLLDQAVREIPKRIRILQTAPTKVLMDELKRRGYYVPEPLSNHTQEEMFEGQEITN